MQNHMDYSVLIKGMWKTKVLKRDARVFVQHFLQSNFHLSFEFMRW